MAGDTDGPDPDLELTGPPRPVLVAGAIVGAEAAALVGLAGFELVDTVTGHPDNVGGALVGVVLALVGAAALGAGARGLLRLSAGARTPVVVLQLLALPIGYTIAFQAGRAGFGGPILIAALAVLYLLFTPPARAAFYREPPH